jgi:hypothetical protein
MKSSALKPVLINDELRLKLRRVIHIEVDNQLIDLLAYIVLHEPTTLYRISKNTKYAVSTVYKKAKKMIHYGLIKPHIHRNEDDLHEKVTYETTVAGLLLCLAYGCVDDEVVLSKLCHKWQMRSYCCQRLLNLIHVLPMLPELDYRVIEEPRALMTLILNNADRLRSMLSDGLFKEVINTAVHYLVSRLFMDGQIVTKSSLLIGNENFVINLSPDGHVYVYICRLCDKQCVATYLSLNNQCYLLYEIRSIKLTVSA